MYVYVQITQNSDKQDIYSTCLLASNETLPFWWGGTNDSFIVPLSHGSGTKGLRSGVTEKTKENTHIQSENHN